METILISHDLWDVVEHGFLAQPVRSNETSEDDEGETAQTPLEAHDVSKEEKIKKCQGIESHSIGNF